jgi:hypothetical protein
MANPVIDLQPELLDLKLYSGDGVDLNITCTDGAGAPLDLSGAVSAQIRVERLTPDPPMAAFSVNATEAYLGKIKLSLTGAQTKALADSNSGHFSGVWDMQWTPSGKQPRTICQGNVECVSDVTR